VRGNGNTNTQSISASVVLEQKRGEVTKIDRNGGDLSPGERCGIFLKVAYASRMGISNRFRMRTESIKGDPRGLFVNGGH